MLAERMTDPKDEDVLLGSIELRLSHTYVVARRDAHLGTPFTPWLMWSRFYNGVQADAQEFLQNLVDVDLSPQLNSCFQGTLRPNLICQSCFETSPVAGVENFTTLVIDVAREGSLQDAVDSFLRTQESVTTSDWVCPRCVRIRTAKKQNNIIKFPKTVLIQLNRFATNKQKGAETAHQVYLRHHVECEETVNIQGQSYRLRAKVYHLGNSLDVGHYYTVCRHELPQGRWWYCNDTERRLARPTDNDPRHARVYLCLYERA